MPPKTLLGRVLLRRKIKAAEKLHLQLGDHIKLLRRMLLLSERQLKP